MLKILSLIVITLGSVVFLYAQEPLRVTARTGELRGTPDGTGIVITTVDKDETGEVIASRGSWCLIQTSKYVGWIERDKITITKSDPWTDPNGRFASPSDGAGIGMGQGSGSGTGSGIGPGSVENNGSGSSNITPLKLFSKPKPLYTEIARKNQIQGTVLLKITFLADGTIGPITVVKGLPDGLNEAAISAARRIKFEPKKVDGVTKNVIRNVEFSFSLF